MPTLLEVQQAIGQSMVTGDAAAAAAFIDPAAADRINIYRNTFLMSLTRALRLCYPVVRRLVGEDFFDGAAELFIAQSPPRAACLDQYGDEFSAFLRRFPPTLPLPYIADVAALEWAVNMALHAADAKPIELDELTSIAPEQRYRLRFIGHPSVRLLRLSHPVDFIWRAVLTDDHHALRATDLDAGPVHLLVERRAAGIEVVRQDAPAWRLSERLFAGEPIEAALESTSGFEASAVLADHLTAGRFISFALAGDDNSERCTK